MLISSYITLEKQTALCQDNHVDFLFKSFT